MLLVVTGADIFALATGVNPNCAANFNALFKAFLFNTGLAPGCPKQIGQTLVFGSSVVLRLHPQNSFVFVKQIFS